MKDKAIQVLLVDDHELARGGVRLMLSGADDIVVTAEAANAVDAMRVVASASIDVALVDINLPGRNGLDLFKQLRVEHGHIAAIMLSTHSEEIYGLRALRLGAAGYFCKDVAPPALIEAVRKVAAGGKCLSERLIEKIASQVGGGVAGHDALSAREFEVMKRLAAGETISGIGAALFLSPKTITTYRARIFERMGISCNADLTRYAIEHGLL